MAFFQITVASDGDVLDLRKTGDVYRIVLSITGKELAVIGPDIWQGNMNILSPSGTRCGVVWPHFLMNSEGKWLTDKVESEGMKLVDFEVLKPSGSVVGYRGKWSFRDYFQSSETHFTWYEPTELTQVHLIRTRLRILKDLEGVTTTWVEFMTPENSYTTAASMTKGGEVLTMDVSGTGEERNMHYWDGNELDPNGWITIYDCKNGQAGCAAMVPLRFSTSSIHPRINNGHVDNIEIHMLDARKRNNLKKGQEVFLEYLFIAGPDRKDSKWIAHSVKQARSFMKQFALLNRQ